MAASAAPQVTLPRTCSPSASATTMMVGRLNQLTVGLRLLNRIPRGAMVASPVLRTAPAGALGGEPVLEHGPLGGGERGCRRRRHEGRQAGRRVGGARPEGDIHLG